MSLLKGWLSKEKPVETIQQPVEQEASMPDVQEQATQASLQAELDKLTGENAELTSQLANVSWVFFIFLLPFLCTWTALTPRTAP